MKEKENGLTSEITYCLLAVADHVWNKMVIRPSKTLSCSAAELHRNYKNYTKDDCWIEKGGVDLQQIVSICLDGRDGVRKFKMSFRLLDVFDILSKFEKMQSGHKNIRFTDKGTQFDMICGYDNDARNWCWYGTNIKLSDGSFLPEGNYDNREPNNKKLHHPVTTIKNGDWYDERVKANEKLLRQQILEKGSRWFFMFNG